MGRGKPLIDNGAAPMASYRGDAIRLRETFKEIISEALYLVKRVNALAGADELFESCDAMIQNLTDHAADMCCDAVIAFLTGDTRRSDES